MILLHIFLNLILVYIIVHFCIYRLLALSRTTSNLYYFEKLRVNILYRKTPLEQKRDGENEIMFYRFIKNLSYSTVCNTDIFILSS